MWNPITLGIIAGPLVDAIKSGGDKDAWRLAVRWGWSIASLYVPEQRMPSLERTYAAFDAVFDEVKEQLAK